MSKRIFVGNLSWGTTEEDLRNAFAAQGFQIQDVHILLDRESGRSRGFGFVEMGSDEEAQSAIEAFNGTELDGRPLRVNEADERRPDGGGGFGLSLIHI